MTRRPLRILFNTAYREDRPGVQLHHWLETEMAKKAECLFYGPRRPGFNKKEYLDETVKRLYGDNPPDWMIIIPFEKVERINHNRWRKFRASDNRPYKIAMHVDTLNGIREFGAAGVPAMIELMNSMNVDSVLMRVRGVPRFPPAVIEEMVEPDMFHVPPHVDPGVYQPGLPRIYDATLIGSASRNYNLRCLMWNELPGLAEKHGWNMFRRKKSHGVVFKMKISKLIAMGDYAGESYFRLLSQTRALTFGSSIFRYLVQKYVEGMACENLIVADEPMDSDVMRLKDGYNYAAVTPKNWVEVLTYYLEDDEELRRVARNGRETMLKHHTSKIRARQLLDYLRKNR